MNNLRDFKKICRVCMSDGSRDIFLHKITSSSPIPSTSNNNAGIGNNCNSITSKSPLNRLLEKLRYVTMMKIEENDDLPRLLCDLCIVQLNVAYNFKNQAVENDTKLRQYFIENGISSSSSSLSTSGTRLSSSTPNNSNNLILNDNHDQNVKNSLNVSSNTTIATTPTATVNQRFPIIPFIIKTEPTTITDNDSLSDVGIEMNLNSNHRLTPSSLIHTKSNTGRVGAGGGEIQMTSVNCFNRSSNGVDIFEKDENNSSLVYINGFGYNSLTPSSEIESVHNGSGSNSGSHHHQQQQQLQQNHCHENLECNTQENQNNQNITGRNLSAEIENHNRNAKNNSTNPSSTSMAKRKKSNELKNLLINMNLLSSGGSKRNRSVNNTTAEDNTTARNQLRRHKFATTSTASPSSSVRSKIVRKRNLSMKISNMNDGGAVAVNKINVNSSVNNRRSKPLRGQNEFLKNNDNVIRETITMRGTLQSAVASSSSLSSLEHHRTLVINPLSSNNNTNENNNTAGQSKLKKKRLYNEGRIKEKTLTRFIKPKLEPTGK